MSLRPTTVVALGAVALSALLAFIVQLALLGALGWGRIDAPVLVLEPAANVRAANMGELQGLRFDPSRAGAVAQASDVSLAAGNALALILHTEDITSPVRLTLGWLTTFDLRRPSSAAVRLNAGTDAQQSVVLLAGHPRWREQITRVAVGLERIEAATTAANANTSAFLARAEWLPANPLGGARLMAAAWFKATDNVVNPTDSPVRLLPLSLWLALIACASLMLAAFFYRKQPEQRATALRQTAAVIALAALALTINTNSWPGWTVPLGGGAAAALALLLLDRSIRLPQLPINAAQRFAVALLCAGIAVLIAPLVAAVAVIPGVLLWLGQRHAAAHTTATAPSPRLHTMHAGALLALIPALLLAAVAQGMIPAPSLLTPLIDPTKTLAAVATTAGGLPGLVLGALALHQLWPAPALSSRWSESAVAATLWAVIGGIALLAIPRIAALAAGGSTYIAVFFPALACLALALLPKFQFVAKTVDETLLTEAKTELDLSANALALLSGHGERAHAALARGEIGRARQALLQMQNIAPAARATHLAALRITLAEGNLRAAETAATALSQTNQYSPAESDALLELAHRSQQHPRVIALAASASKSEGNQRAVAIAQLMTDAHSDALKTLTAWPNEATFAREIAELHLLNDDLPATQQALVNSGLSLTEPSGQAYVARLGMRVQGTELHAQGINSLATWHPQLGAVQAAQGELLLRQGNASGARARFMLALKLDPQLWPLQRYLQQIDALKQPTISMPAAAKVA
jgi:hypothetical protein